MEKWLIKSSNNSISKLGSNIREQILYGIIANRGIEDKEALREYLDPSLDKMHSPDLLLDMTKAGQILVEAINKKEKIRIIGDYDVDGITSTYMLYDYLKSKNPNVDYQIPHRVEDGYGINCDMVKLAKRQGVDLIMTCDNGISAMDPIDLARELEIKVIVTDHHQPLVIDGEEKLPSANAVIDPMRVEDTYPFKEISGGVVAYKLIEYVAELLGDDQGQIVRDYLEFAAISTVCDVMPLIGENRAIVRIGLELLNNTTNIGLKAIMDVQGILDTDIKAYHLGFVIGPMFNATGRLSSADMALDLLLDKQYGSARQKATELKKLNQERMDITESGLESALEIIEEQKLYNDDIMVIYDESIHQSVAGIIAGRIKERYYRPTIVLTKDKDLAKGSGRSIEEYDMIRSLQQIESIFSSFGGHSQAAGMSLPVEDVDKLRQLLNDNSQLTMDDLTPKVYIDLGLPIRHVDLELIGDLDRLEPFGVNNPRPKFGARNVELLDIQLLGKDKQTVKMVIRQDEMYHTGIMFKGADVFNNLIESTKYTLEEFIDKKQSLMADIIYSPQINEWRGNISVQLILESIRLVGGQYGT